MLKFKKYKVITSFITSLAFTCLSHTANSNPIVYEGISGSGCVVPDNPPAINTIDFLVAITPDMSGLDFDHGRIRNGTLNITRSVTIELDFESIFSSSIECADIYQVELSAEVTEGSGSPQAEEFNIGDVSISIDHAMIDSTNPNPTATINVSFDVDATADGQLKPFRYMIPVALNAVVTEMPETLAGG